MTNYLATDTDLTSVADAIRTKGGTSADLEFPDGFVSAIEAIPSGGGVPDGIEIGSFTVASSSSSVTIEHNFGVIPNICVVFDAKNCSLAEQDGSSIMFEYLAGKDNGDIALASVFQKNSDSDGYRTTSLYTTYPASITAETVTFVQGRYYGAKFLVNHTYFYVIAR